MKVKDLKDWYGEDAGVYYALVKADLEIALKNMGITPAKVGEEGYREMFGWAEHYLDRILDDINLSEYTKEAVDRAIEKAEEDKKRKPKDESLYA